MFVSADRQVRRRERPGRRDSTIIRPSLETGVPERCEREVGFDGALPPDERRRRAQNAPRAHRLKIAKQSTAVRRLN